MLGLMLARARKCRQNPEVKILSRSDTMSDGKPWSRQMFQRKRRAISGASAVVLVGEKCAILEKRSTTTRMASLPEGETGRPTMKSMEMDSQGREGTGRETRWPCGLWRGALARAQVELSTGRPGPGPGRVFSWP